MEFASFLLKRRERRKISSTKDHFESLGGESKLKISLRHFREIENGNQRPSEKILEIIFEESFADEKKELVVSYFRSVLSSSKSQLLNYIQQSLQPAQQEEEKSIWDSRLLHMIYSVDQLDFLTKNEDALIFHKKLLLFDKCHEKDANISKQKLEKLIELDLIEFKNKTYSPSRTLYKVPRYENSPPKVVAKASDYILKQMDVFLAKEGSPAQELSYAFQMVDENSIPQIMDQMKSFKNWLQSMATKDHNPPNKPFVYVSFGRVLDNKDLGSSNETK